MADEVQGSEGKVRECETSKIKRKIDSSHMQGMIGAAIGLVTGIMMLDLILGN